MYVTSQYNLIYYAVLPSFAMRETRLLFLVPDLLEGEMAEKRRRVLSGVRRDAHCAERDLLSSFSFSTAHRNKSDETARTSFPSSSWLVEHLRSTKVSGLFFFWFFQL